MKWEGAAEFRAMQKDVVETIRFETARAMMEVAKEQRDRALEGFWTYGIKMITGRSRALYAIHPGEGMFTPLATKVVVEVGYNAWPETDVHSPDEPIPFYPWFLNYGTSKMSARPFHSAAILVTEPIFQRRTSEAMAKAFDKMAAKYGKHL